MPDNTEPNTESQPVDTRRSAALKKFAITLIIFAVLWVILAYGLPLVARLSGVPTTPFDQDAGEPLDPAIEQKDQEIEALNGRIGQLEARLKAFEDAVSGMPKTPADNAAMTAMQAKIDALSQQPAAATAEDNERVTALEDKVAQQQKLLEQMQTQLGMAQAKGTHEIAVITMFGQVKDAIARGDAYADLLAQLKTLVPDDRNVQELLEQLALNADNGPMTLPILQNAFEATVPVALSPGSASGSLMGNLRSLIRIRKVGTQQLGSDDESVVARAEAKLGRGDVEGSVKELAQLSPPAATAFATWNNQAQNYVHLHDTLAALQLALVAPTPQPPAQPAPPPPPAAKPVTPPAPAPAVPPKTEAPADAAPDADDNDTDTKDQDDNGKTP